jgi:hypothetical protein
MTNKTTKKDYFNAIIAMATGAECTVAAEDIVAFCEKEIATLANRAEKARERAAIKRAEGDELQNAVLEALTDEFATRDEVTGRIDPSFEASVAKVGYRLSTLVKLGKAEKGELVVVGEDGKNKKMAAYRAI